MVQIQAFLPGISLGAGSLLARLFKADESRRKFRSTLQPPGYLFFIAWALQAVSLGFVGQGIFAHTEDALVKILFYIFAGSLGPAYATSVILASYEPYLALYYDMMYVAGLLVLAIMIWKRGSYKNAPYISYMLPTIGWISFAGLLTVTAWAGATMAKSTLGSREMVNILSGRKIRRR